MIKYSSPGNNHTVLPSFSLRTAEARPESHAAAMEASSMSRPCGFGGENKEGLQGKNDHRSAVNWRESASTWNCFTFTCASFQTRLCSSVSFPHLLSPGEPGDSNLAASVRPTPSVPSGKLTSAAHPPPVEPFAP